MGGSGDSETNPAPDKVYRGNSYAVDERKKGAWLTGVDEDR